MSTAAKDNRSFPNDFPRDIGDNTNKIMDSDKKRVSTQMGGCVSQMRVRISENKGRMKDQYTDTN